MAANQGKNEKQTAKTAESSVAAASASATTTGREKYERLKVIVPARVDKRFGLGLINTLNKQVRVSTIMPDSVASDFFFLKDRLVCINGVPVTDKIQCRQLILSACSSAPDFEVVIDRIKKDQIADVTVKEKLPNKQTVTEIPDLSFCPVAKDPDDEKGDPWYGYQYAPPDVRRILQNRIKSIVNDILPPYKRTGTTETVVTKQAPAAEANFNIDEKAQLMPIASDVPPEKQLMKPRK